MQFVHLHVHTYYSILDGAAPIKEHFKKAQENNQPALAITDHGNMFGVKEFFKVAKDFPDIKPIIGCEVYVNPEGRFTKRGKEDQSAHHLILLAKNLKGYYNLVKLVSLGYTDGFYYKPKIDKELLEKYHENLICSSACLGGEIPQKIMKGDLEGAKESVLWYRNLFGEDYYLEVQLHKSEIPGWNEDVYEHQLVVNKEIFRLSEECGVKIIATNDVHFTRKEDGPAHDRLICLTTNSYYDETDRLKYTQQEYLKTGEEMAALFPDHPEVISNTLEVADKIEKYKIDCDHILPIFNIPEEFPTSDDYLRHLTYEGAKERYAEITPEIEERIDFELGTIKRMGFPDYFLIVQDFINAARKIGVWVGPGRGSAAGSVVAYCLGITQIDPIKYDLLFERFLNPERISMPDIDIDFDDEGRGKVLQYVEGKYGKDHVSHVVTFGTMAAKSAIKDLARIQRVPLAESARLAGLIPDKFPSDTIKEKGPNGEEIVKEKKNKVTLPNCLRFVPQIKDALEHSEIPGVKDTINYALKLEGTVRNTGVHACAIIIGRDNLTEHIPICIAKDKETGKDMWVSQYEGSFIEDVGMLKMDFLGLRTLSILKEAVRNIKRHRGIDLDIDHIPLDDKPTYDLFSRGDTVATFQFESPGMQKWLRELKPSRFEDLIAMNALYRPGPMEYIPQFVERKSGKQAIKYDLPEMENILKDTYGITVYQEQVMLLSQKLANFTKGQADGLRKAMGKKLIDKMMELKTKFIDGGIANGHPVETLEKIWDDWTAFAEYAFNKSHATCYAWVGYQTAYLKANYPAEFMAANLSNNLNNISEITKFMDESKRMGIEVLGPDINESDATFSVNREGNIRFGLGGIKGVGAAVIENIIKEKENGPYKDLFDFVERNSTNTPVNRKTLENLAYAGAFDSFEGIRREQYFSTNSRGDIFIDALTRYSSRIMEDKMKNAVSLFGEGDSSYKPATPEIPAPGEYNKLEFLRKEKDLVGMYLSAHPLDMYKFEIKNFTTCSLLDMEELLKEVQSGQRAIPDDFYISGIVSDAEKKLTKGGKPWGTLTVEDYKTSHTFSLFGKDYENFMQFLQRGETLFLKCAIARRYTGPSKEGESNKSVEYVIKIKKITLLANVKDDFTRAISLNIPLQQIDSAFSKEFSRTLKHNKGNIPLILNIMDNEIGCVGFVPKKIKVDTTQEFIDYLEHNHISYRIEKARL